MKRRVDVKIILLNSGDISHQLRHNNSARWANTKMHVLQALAVMAFFVPTSMASFESNINYASPSYRHTQLGVDVAHVDRRSWKRGNTAIDPSALHFTHGVASGDPWPDSVILWTRVAPSNRSEASTAPINGTTPLHSHETEKFVEADHHPVCVSWEVFEEGQLDSQAPKASGKAYTTSDIDYTIKVIISQPFDERAAALTLSNRLKPRICSP